MATHAPRRLVPPWHVATLPTVWFQQNRLKRLVAGRVARSSPRTTSLPTGTVPDGGASPSVGSTPTARRDTAVPSAVRSAQPVARPSSSTGYGTAVSDGVVR